MENNEQIIENEQKYSDENLALIEEKRAIFLGTYRKQNIWKTIVLILALGIIVFGWIISPNLNLGKNLTFGVQLGSIVLGIGLILVYSVVTKRDIDKKMHKYFADFYNLTNAYVFNQEGFENVVLQEPGKIQKEQFIDCGLYKDIFEVGSRGLTEFEFNGIPMAVCDCAGQIKAEKRVMPVYVGKFMFAAANYTDDRVVAIYLKGNEKSLPPTNTDAFEKVEDNEKYAIYSNNPDWKKVLNKKVMTAINEIQMNEVLVDLAISIHSGRVFVCMGYDDPLMILPLQSEFNAKPTEFYKKDMLLAAKVVEALNI